MPIEAEAFAEMEAVESESESEAAEALPFRRPSSRPSFVPRSFGPAPAVSQGQLQAALSRVDQKVATLAGTESTINSRVNSLAAATKKEVADRKKSVETQIKDMNQKLQLFALLPLLLQPPSAAKPNVGGAALVDANNQPITAVSVPDTNSLSALLPLLLVSGMGGTGSSGGLSLGGDGSGSDGSLLLLALVLAFGSKK